MVPKNPTKFIHIIMYSIVAPSKVCLSDTVPFSLIVGIIVGLVAVPLLWVDAALHGVP